MGWRENVVGWELGVMRARVCSLWMLGLFLGYALDLIQFDLTGKH